MIEASVEKQQESKPPKLTGFQLHPEHINLKGRPKKGFTLADVARGLLDETLPTGVTRKEALIRKVMQMAYEGDPAMIKLVWNYVDGMPQQNVDVTSAGQPLPILGGASAPKTEENAENEPISDDKKE